MKNITLIAEVVAWLMALWWPSLLSGIDGTDRKTIIEQKCPEKEGSYNPSGLSDARRFLELHDCRYELWTRYFQRDVFQYETNMTDENRKAKLKVQAERAKFTSEMAQKANKFNWREFEDKNLTMYFWFKAITAQGIGALPAEKYKELTEVKSDMERSYSTQKLCKYGSKKKCDLGLETDIVKIMATSRNYQEMKYYWKAWRDAISKKLKKKYIRYVQLSNEMARLNDYTDYGDMFKANENVKGLEAVIAQIWEEVKPLYKQLHAYVRRKLIEQYGSKYIRPDGPIPAHLLGHMFSQLWNDIIAILAPYPESPAPDVTEELQRRKMKPKEMFKIAEQFFVSLGMHKMTKTFWKKTVMEKPKNIDMVCHASAWDLADGEDFRIKMCTQTNMRDFITVHHEMGHIQYYQQYAHLPQVFRNGANTGFHEAVGDTIALSVSTPKHLHKIKLLKSLPNDTKSDITFLLKMALSKLVFLPSSYIYDLWRWKLFSGEITQKEMNSQWWKMRSEYEGLCPPVRRTEKDIDPLAKYHVATDTPYIRYFVGHIHQFQFHKALCKEAGHKGPLHKCDIYQSKKAGKLFSKMLRLGSSVPWPEQIAVITKDETDELSAAPLLEYFEPLMEWLKEQNKDEVVGWSITDPMLCPQGSTDTFYGAESPDEPLYLKAHIRDEDDRTDE